QVRPEAESAARAKDYWRQRIATLPPAPQLALARDPASVEAPRFTRREGRLNPGQWQTLQRKARQHRVTPSAVLLSCYAEVLGAWSGRRDLSIMTTLFDRRDVHPDIHRVLGDFTSLSVAAYEPVVGEVWLESVQRLHVQRGRDLDNRDASGLWVLRELARKAQAPTAAIPVVFTSVLGLPGGVSIDRSRSFPRQVWALTQTPQMWLDHKVYESQGGLAFDWDAVEDLFPSGLLDAAFDSYCGLLGWLVESDWNAPLPPLLPSTQWAARQRVNDTAGAVPEHTLHAGFFSMARKRPDRPALLGEDGALLTYGDLADRALRIGALLKRHGVRLGDAVAITLPKGFEQVAAVLGVLAAGAVYVPVGVEQPQSRRDNMYASASVRVVLTEHAQDAPSAGAVPAQLAVGDAEAEPPLPAAVEVPLGSLAYVIFTSGSTGQPKGVEITHCAAMNTVDDINTRFQIGPEDRVLAVSALDFDLSVYDLFGLLSVGGAVVLVREAERRDAHRWVELAQRHGITVWNSVPVLLDMWLVAAQGAGLPASLRLVLLSGDWVGLDLPDRLRALRSGCRLVALGGATEGSIWSNACEVDTVPSHWRSVPYGLPLRNQCYRVVDDRGRDCPDWVSGELWIGGLGVAAGYRGDPEQTAAKFVEHAGRRWYRTGDLGRYWPDGTLEFLGRLDQQVKIRGHRIELGEI
ncbi:MAG TPA: amino acid adenylation domain-containing protein, partial [Polyangiaceae bacterium]